MLRATVIAILLSMFVCNLPATGSSPKEALLASIARYMTNAEPDDYRYRFRWLSDTAIEVAEYHPKLSQETRYRVDLLHIEAPVEVKQPGIIFKDDEAIITLRVMAGYAPIEVHNKREAVSEKDRFDFGTTASYLVLFINNYEAGRIGNAFDQLIRLSRSSQPTRLLSERLCLGRLAIGMPLEAAKKEASDLLRRASGGILPKECSHIYYCLELGEAGEGGSIELAGDPVQLIIFSSKIAPRLFGVADYELPEFLGNFRKCTGINVSSGEYEGPRFRVKVFSDMRTVLRARGL